MDIFNRKRKKKGQESYLKTKDNFLIEWLMYMQTSYIHYLIFFFLLKTSEKILKWIKTSQKMGTEKPLFW